MKILFEKNNTLEYIAKIYWSLQKGLKSEVDLTTYGEKQDYYVDTIKDYQEIIELCFGQASPDVIIVDFKYGSLEFPYQGIEKLKGIKKGMILGDYWSIPDKKKFIDIVNKNFDFVLTLFYEPFDCLSEIKDKLVFSPPSVDSEIFKDWGEEKKYDVGFLGSGCEKLHSTYPERFRISQLLKEKFDTRFYSDRHPGWGYFAENSKLVGKGFSQVINKCRLFLSTSGVIGHCNPKYYEIMASGSLLFAGKCKYFEKTNFKNEINCVTFDTDKDLLEKIDFWLSNNKREILIEKGLETIRKFHTSEKRGHDVVESLKKKLRI